MSTTLIGCASVHAYCYASREHWCLLFLGGGRTDCPHVKQILLTGMRATHDFSGMLPATSGGYSLKINRRETNAQLLSNRVITVIVVRVLG